ncbi:MAG: polysaccharide pyruvyl transferase family protein [Rhodobacteraceae bacterium]|nr:polysaccharide pyruvyl transferase family protein [Paracoccaceae bacterium]
MRLTYYRGSPPNFGDELNALLWPQLLPEGLLDDDPSELFLGIGSIIGDDLPAASRKVVAGSGYGGYSGLPDLRDGRWSFLWVRGPRTAQRLGLDPGAAIADGAVLLRAIRLPAPAAPAPVAFMPHVDSVARGAWDRVCRLAGIRYLDPRRPVAELLPAIASAGLVISEAMHGAIVADALRRPWVAMLPIIPLHRAKWEDWAASLGLDLSRHRLPPSNLREAWSRGTGLYATGRRSRALFDNVLAGPFNAAVAERAAARLAAIARDAAPQLSADARIAEATERCLEALDRFVRERGAGPAARALRA